MQIFEFEKLQIKEDGNWLQRKLKDSHFKRTLLFALGGAIVGFVVFLLSEDRPSDVYWNQDAVESIVIGLLVGLFITNSPCAKGRC